MKTGLVTEPILPELLSPAPSAYNDLFPSHGAEISTVVLPRALELLLLRLSTTMALAPKQISSLHLTGSPATIKADPLSSL